MYTAHVLVRITMFSEKSAMVRFPT